MDHLPPESATTTAIRNSIPEDELAQRRRDPKQAQWSSVESLLATLIDEIRISNWLYVSAHSKSKIKPPTPIARPGLSSGRRRRQMTAAELKELDPRLRGLSDEDAVAKYQEMTGRG